MLNKVKVIKALSVEELERSINAFVMCENAHIVDVIQINSENKSVLKVLVTYYIDRMVEIG